MKKPSGSIGAIVAIFVLLIFLLSMCNGDSGGGDGKSSCRNCGRNKPLSSMGYCSTCQEGFNKGQDRYYGDD